MSLIGPSLLGRGLLQSPPSRRTEPSTKAEEFKEPASQSQDKAEKVSWGKVALGLGSGLAALGALASPAGQAFVQEHHLAQCLGMSDPVELIDISIEAQVPDDIPAESATAQENAQWWKSLKPEQQNELLQSNPLALGNREGLPAQVRDLANRSRLKLENTALQERKAELEAEVQSQSDDLPYTLEAKLPGMKLEAVQNRLDDLNRIEKAADGGEDRYLLVLDTSSGEKPHAAIAEGNPDQADHIFVSVPGVNTSVRSLRRMLEEGSNVVDSAQEQLTQAGRSGESISNIAWVAYDTPNVDGSFCQKVNGGLDSASESKAREGAESLSEFYQGLDAAHDPTEDPNITAVGHSYGSLTTSLALQNGGHSVDNLVVYGSPGLALDNYSDLGIQPGHGYEMTAHGDKVPEFTGKIRWFGESTKSDPDLIHLSTESQVIDGVEYEGVYAHSQYPQNGNNGRVRISGYNIAGVVSGLEQNAVTVG